MASPTVYIPGWLRIVATISHEGSTMLFPADYQYTTTGGMTAGQILECVTNWWALLGAAWAANNASSYSVLQITGTDMAAAGRATATYVPTTNTSGTKAGDALPASAAAVATWRSGLTGRSNRGRTYFFGFQEQDTIGSFFTNGALATLGTLVADVKNFSNGTGAVPVSKVIPSRKKLLLTQVTSAFIDNIVDSQRRRLPGRGQ